MKGSSLVLKEALSKAPRGTSKQIAKQANISPSYMSKVANGSRKLAKDISVSVSKSLHSIKFSYSEAKENYGIISFKDDGKINDDLFSITTDQKKQERERTDIEPQIFEILSKKRKLWSSQEHKDVQGYLNEFTEEIASEITELIYICDFSNVDSEKLIKAVNDKMTAAESN